MTPLKVLHCINCLPDINENQLSRFSAYMLKSGIIWNKFDFSF